ncbi:putative Translation initiation factor IF-2 [Leptomonas seymouri]|uniref:Translation initiation factor IF-2, chloroplastic n=1 Tax=Leptomonas seymouri TaxID=5684 RepID=A0A0N1PEY4_LEPSE|nr:putative Translation initiation factor IF-2 [Leptomonas seymouri]|eukprot:KPI89412.1 putative Translation initiation factor IF-2 [Leptomonas seymouri]
MWRSSAFFTRQRAREVSVAAAPAWASGCSCGSKSNHVHVYPLLSNPFRFASASTVSFSLSGHHRLLTPSTLCVARRCQSQSSRGKPSMQWQDGVVDPRYSSEGNMRQLNPDTMPHYVKATIQKDRREMGLGEVFDWAEFAKDAIYIPTRSGPLWVGSDDPRASKFVRRKEKMKRKPLQRTRPKPGPDPAKALEDHPLREYFTTATNLHDPLSVATGLHRAGRIREYDIKHTAAKIEYTARPPIVSIMGHVDHGKTTLLDHLRRSNVAASEAGGITQNVGAFQVKTPDGHSITFIDTPGHAAFTAMREVGAVANDMIILIVSAVDGVQPQTREVIELAQRQGTPMLVAITKIDRQPDCDYIKEQLRTCNVELEEDGGDTQLVKICAKDGRGIPDLLEAIQLQAELSEVSAPTPSRAELYVLESRNLEVTEVAAVVRCGTVQPGQVLVSGTIYGTVKRILDDQGATLGSAGPSVPVILQGIRVPPKPGSILMQVSSEAHAEKFSYFMRDVYSVEGGRENYLQVLKQEQRGHIEGRKPDNNIVRAFSTKAFILGVKAATFGMLQALLKTIYELPRLEGVSLEVKVTEVGGLKDYDLALVGGAGRPGCVLLFGDCKDSYGLDVPNHVSLVRFNVLYHGIEELKRILVDSLPKIEKTRVLATAECLQTFKASQAGRGGNAGGMKVTSGTLDASHLTCRVIRKHQSMKATLANALPGSKGGASTNGVNEDESVVREVVYEGQMKELRRFKDLVPTVETGLECGVVLFDDFSFRTGDVLEQYEVYEESRDVAEEFEAAERREKILRMQAEAQARMEAEAEATSAELTQRSNELHEKLTAAAAATAV